MRVGIFLSLYRINGLPRGVIKISKFSNTIEYNLRTTLDASGITQLQGQLSSINTQLDQMSKKQLISSKEATQAQNQIKQLRDALSSSLNSQTGFLDLSKFKQQLSGLSLSQLEQSMSKVGATGQIAFGNMIGQIGRMDTSFKSISSFADKIFNTMGNTVRWGITATIFQTIQNSLYRAVGYVQELDTSLNNIRIVTSASNEDMRNFALYANEAAQAIGASTTSFTDAAQLYAQNGFNEEDYTRLAEITTKVANVTQQNTTDVSEQITALMEGYHMSIDQVEESLGGMAVVAAASAADLEELATAEQKVASTANSLGVSHEQLTAQIGTIVSVTRQAPESVGNAIRTLYARLADLQMGETLEDGVDLGAFSGQLKQVGIDVLDAEGNLRNLGDVLEELQGVWGTLSNGQQVALGTTLAGKYQLNPFMALMENADMYQEQLEMMRTSDGALEEQQAIYMDSIQAKMQQLTTAGEGLISHLFDPQAFSPALEAITNLLNLVTDLVDSLGGVGPILTSIGGIGMKVFSNQLGQSINNMVTNASRARAIRENAVNAPAVIEELGGLGNESQHESSSKLVDSLGKFQGRMSKEQQDAYNEALQKTVNLENAVVAAQDNQQKAEKALTAAVRERYKTLITSETNERTAITPTADEVKKKVLQQVQTDMAGTTNAIEIVNRAFKDLESGTSARGMSSRMSNRIKELQTALQGVDTDLSPVIEKMSVFSNSMDGSQLDEAIDEATTALIRYKKELQGIHSNAEVVDAASKQFEQSKANSVQAEGELASNTNVNQLVVEGIQRQVQVQDVASMVGNIGELAFAWQSFQALGSLWANTDLSTGEKVQQTIMNLLMTVPQLVMAFADMKEIVSTTSFGDLAGTLSNYSKEAFASAKANLSFSTSGIAAAASSAAMGTASKVASGGIKLLSNALNTLTGPIGIAITLGTMLASTLISASEAAREASLDSGMEQYEDAQATASLDFSEFDAAYDEYKRTGSVSDELKTSSKQLAESLGVVGAQALINADNFGELADRINEAKEASQTTVNQAAENQLNAISSDTSAYNLFQDDFQHAIYGDSEFQSRTGITQDGFGGDTSGMDAVEKLGAMNQALEESNARMEELREQQQQFDEGSVVFEELQRQIDAEQEVYDRISSLAGQYNFDDVAQITQEQAQAAENALDSADFAGMTLEGIEATLTDRQGEYSAIADYYATLGDEAGQAYINSLISAIASGDSDIALQYAQQNFADKLNQKFTNTNPEDVAGLSELYDTLGEAGVDTSNLTEEQINAINEAMTQSVIEQVNNSSLSEEDKATLMNNIDWSQPIGDILAQVSQAVNTGSVEGVMVGNPEDFMDDERDARLDSYSLDEGVIDTYTDIQKQTTDLSSREDELTQRSKEAAEAAQEAADAYGKTSEEYKEAAKAADDAENTLEAYNDTQEDLVDMSLQSQKGMEALSESIEDNAKILREGDTDSLEYAEAMDDTRQAVADLVNVSKDDISPQFVTDNLDTIEKAAYGDVEAIQQLRIAAANEILVQINKTGNLTPENLAYLQQKAQELATMNIEPYAAIDDANFIAQLNNMMANGQMTAEQVQSYLNSIGYDPVIGTETIDYTAFTIPGKSIPINVLGMEVGSIDIPDINIQGKTQMPKIESVQSIGSGSYAPVSSTARGNRPSSSSGGGSGSSGGGNGSGSGGGGGSSSGGGSSGESYEPKEQDRVEDELDRYERVNAELDTLANRYEAVADEQERLAGFDVADNMSKQIGLIKEQIKWEEEKLKIQKDEAEEYRNQLASQYGITYDAEGHITNYANVYKKLLNELNGLIDQYNATTTESGQEALDKQIEDAQNRFDDFNDLIEDYDELVSNSILETEKEIQDFYDQIEDLQIEAFQKAVDAVDNIKDLQETLIDFNAVFTGLNSDSPFRDMIVSLENLKTYWDVNTIAVDDYYDELIKRNNEAMKNASKAQKENLKYQNVVLEAAREQYGKGTFEAGGTGLFDMTMTNLNTILEQMRQFEETGTSTIFGENSGSMYEVGNDIFEQATSLLEDYEGHIDDLRDAIIDGIDEIGDKMDERLETYENINDELEHYADIIEMVQGENAYDQLNQVSQATIANNQAIINELKQNIALWQDMLAAMEEGSEEWKTVNEYITNAQQELLEKTSDTVEEMLEMYERGVQDILDKWIGSTGMGDDLDWIAEEWELINRNADYYLDDVNAAYEIQKLQGKYLDLLDDANGLDVQNQITQQMAQQLAYLREKDKLSEYDVQYANAQLEILQKTIALQEAQRNKSQLQLRRDNQGNYSYVYTADENDTRAAQGDLLDAQNNAYNLSKNQMQQTQADSLSALQDARDTLEQIWTNANLTLDEKTKRTQTIVDSLKEYLAGTSEQLSESEKNIINDFLGMCETLTEENDERLQDVYEQIINGNKDAFDQIDTRWQTSITNWLQNMEEFNAATDQSFQGLIDNFEDYQGQLDELGELAGMTFDDMSDSIQNAVDKTNDLASSTSSFISQLKNDAGTVKEYEAALAEMTAKIQDAENGMRAYQEQVNQLQQNLTAKEQENANLTSQVQDLQSQIDAMKNPGGGSGGSGGGGGGANSDTAWGIAKAIWTYGGASGWGNDPIRSSKLIKAYGSDFARQVQTIINQNYRSGKLVDYGSMKYSSYNLIGYRSGGFTGDDWSAAEKQAGKIALLHEKELVLNKTDTENILNAVDMVRSMVALGRNGNYNDIIRQSNNVVDMASVVQPLDDMGQTIYQVECTFPNATNVDEIQRAILTLPDIAPQYAYKS